MDSEFGTDLTENIHWMAVRKESKIKVLVTMITKTNMATLEEIVIVFLLIKRQTKR